MSALETNQPESYYRMLLYFDFLHVMCVTGKKATEVRVILSRVGTSEYLAEKEQFRIFFQILCAKIDVKHCIVEIWNLLLLFSDKIVTRRT